MSCFSLSSRCRRSERRGESEEELPGRGHRARGRVRRAGLLGGQGGRPVHVGDGRRAVQAVLPGRKVPPAVAHQPRQQPGLRRGGELHLIYLIN